LKTIYRFTTGFAHLLNTQNTVMDVNGRLEQIRSAMLDTLRVLDFHTDSRTWTDIDRANDAQTLWYLRSEVMHMLCAGLGEEIARERLDEITEIFRGMVPEAQMPVIHHFHH